MNYISSFLAATLMLLVFSAQALTVSNSGTITAAAYGNDIAQLETLTEQSTGYDRAYGLYRLAQLGFVEPGDHLQPLLDEATAILTPLTHPEAQLLLAAVHNLSMGLNPRRAQQLAPQVNQLLTEAKQHTDSRGRALLIEGINRFFTPAAYGGGADPALDLLQQAAAAFADGSATTGAVTWGEAETELWLGQIFAALQQTETAREHYDRALAATPSCLWAQHYKNQL